MAKTKTEILRDALITEGWKSTQTRSGRECYTKLVGQAPYFIWLGTAALRGGRENSFTKSVSLEEKAKQLLAKYAPKGGEQLLQEFNKL